MPDNEFTKRGVTMSVYAVPKKEPYVISEEEARRIASTPRNEEAHQRAKELANEFRATCLKKGAEARARRLMRRW